MADRNTPDVELEVLGRVLDVLEVHVKVIQRHRAACQTPALARDLRMRCNVTDMSCLRGCGRAAAGQGCLHGHPGSWGAGRC